MKNALLLLLFLSATVSNGCFYEKPNPVVEEPVAQSAPPQASHSSFSPLSSPRQTSKGQAAKPSFKDVEAREAVLHIAHGLIGTTEATGRNDGVMIEKIQASTGNRKGDPYCASFNFYCFEQAGLSDMVPRSAWSPSWVAKPTWTRKSGGAQPRPASAFGIFFPSKGRVAHTGLVDKWGTSQVLTVEANTSPAAGSGSARDRDGDGVWSKRRLVSQIHSVTDWISIYEN